MGSNTNVPHPGETWDEQILRSIPSGVDVTLLEERLELSPTERLERMIAVVRALDQARNEPRDHRLPNID
ncbi:MAG TPA: hypothetical protein VHL58_08485 [Thermoanaerobaculia bacterium]|nr:hypothetical protein [Thermoanaerobaculia bacterium]